MAQPESNERKWILLLCLVAAVHAFIFSAAFPFFNHIDERQHFDLVVKYAHGNFPRGIEPISLEASQYITTWGTPEFLSRADFFPAGRFPTPFWVLYASAPERESRREVAFQQAAVLWEAKKNPRDWQNYESTQPPLYYLLAGLWWHIGQWCGLADLRLIYWVRFLNIAFAAGLVWVGYVAAGLAFPLQPFLRAGVPVLLAFLPAQAFYSIQNDVLSPLCFGVALVCLMRLLSSEAPGARLGAATGLALGLTFLAKMSNLPLIAVAVAAVLFKVRLLAGSQKLRAALPSLGALALCAGLPMAIWTGWCKCHFGDFSGAKIKIAYFGWTYKTFVGWWDHPIFSTYGAWTYLSGQLAAFWQGEFWWHGRPMAWAPVDFIYTMASLFLPALAAIGLSRRSTDVTPLQRGMLCLCLASFIASLAFFAFLSVIYDFHDGLYPSRGYPYFTSGRLMLGALVPFMLLFVYGIDRALKNFGGPAKFFALSAMVLFMLISEITIDWPVFSSQYNWFHT